MIGDVAPAVGALKIDQINSAISLVPCRFYVVSQSSDSEDPAAAGHDPTCRLSGAGVKYRHAIEPFRALQTSDHLVFAVTARDGSMA